ncbi:MAG: MFS transporter [Candidatus Heimdallarchaeota archaeon]|nr:MFS transporter [Candidatus Heimdallarchaeota archaeon]
MRMTTHLFSDNCQQKSDDNANIGSDNYPYIIQRDTEAMEAAEEIASSKSLSQLFLAIFIDLFGFGVIIPILPFLFVDLGHKYGSWFDEYYGLIYGALIASYSLMQFIMAPIWGRISDKHGRRPVILFGVLGSSIGFLLFGLSTNLILLFLARIIAGFFTAATLTTANAYIADVTPPHKRGGAFGLITSAFGLGFALGPAVGGFMMDVQIFGLSGHIVPSLFASILAFLNFVGAYFLVRESLDAKARETIPKNKTLFAIKDIGKLRDFPGTLTFVLLFALVTLGFSNWISSFSLNAPVLDSSVGEPELGLNFTITGLILFISQPLIVKPINNKYGEKIMITTGAILALTGFFLLPTTDDFFTMVLFNIPLVLGISFLNPSITSVISQTVPKYKQGEAMGINQGLASLMRVFGPLIAGGLLGINMFYPYYLGGSIFILIIILLSVKISFPERQQVSEKRIILASSG